MKRLRKIVFLEFKLHSLWPLLSNRRWSVKSVRLSFRVYVFCYQISLNSFATSSLWNATYDGYNRQGSVIIDSWTKFKYSSNFYLTEPRSNEGTIQRARQRKIDLAAAKTALLVHTTWLATMSGICSHKTTGLILGAVGLFSALTTSISPSSLSGSAWIFRSSVDHRTWEQLV